jgi:hypothetical protein
MFRSVARRLTLSAVAIAALIGGLWMYRRLDHAHRYPYGWSHCCDKALSMALWQYADKHNGRYPAGESSPEASLSLLYPDYADANILRGKTVPLETVEAILSAGGRLSPETCGWHYVEDLTREDDGWTALFWDKAGLGHNGERRPQGGHTVHFVNGAVESLSATEWAAFKEKQEQLAKARRDRGSR